MKVIVGIDPGVITAVSIIDINGNFVALESRRYFSKEDIIELVSKYGEPIIISCDVCSPPRLVKKISSTFNSKLIIPNKNMTTKKKMKLIKKFEKFIKNKHERDALASAIFAYHKVLPLLKRVDKVLKEDTKKEEIKAIVIKKKKIGNIKQLIKNLEMKN
jgi:predicted RNase H-like nuclease (RuvC/YqgF family)